MTFSHVSVNAISFTGTGSITSAGKTFTAISIIGGASITLNDAITMSGAFNVTGSLTTNNYNISCSTVVVNNAPTRTINLGSSTWTVTANSGTPWNISSTNNLTFNAGTSTINFTGIATLFVGGGLTYYNVSFSSTTRSTLSMSGANTFNNLTIAGRSTAGVTDISFSANQTINGTLTLSAGTNATMRTFLRSDTIGTTRTLTCSAATATDIDFRDITIAGSAAPVSGTRLGDCKGNSGIAFDAPKMVYYNAANGVSWNNLVIWALSPGGAVSGNNFPLAQDTAVFTSTEPTSGQTITINAAYNIGTIDMSARTSNTMTLATGTNSLAIYGNWINGTGTALTGTGTLTFAGRTSQTITSAGKTFTQGFAFNSPSGSINLQDAFSAPGPTIFSGTFNADIYNVTVPSFSTSGTATKTVTIGSGTWTLNGSGTPWNFAASTNLTVTGTGTISLTSASAKTFAGGGIQTYPTLNQGGTGALTVTGSNKFKGLTNTAIGSILFAGGTTNIFDSFTISGAVANLLTLSSTNTTQATLQKSTAWQMGLLSTDSGNNTNLSFVSSDGTMEYLNVSYINGTVVAPPPSSIVYGNFLLFFN